MSASDNSSERAPLRPFKHAGVVILRIPGYDHDLADGIFPTDHVIEGAAVRGRAKRTVSDRAAITFAKH